MSATGPGSITASQSAAPETTQLKQDVSDLQRRLAKKNRQLASTRASLKSLKQRPEVRYSAALRRMWRSLSRSFGAATVSEGQEEPSAIDVAGATGELPTSPGFAHPVAFEEDVPYFGLDGVDRAVYEYIGTDPGIFFEAGANDGVDQSNTCHLERVRGWTGILVEAVPRLAELCASNRTAIVHQFALVPPELSGSTINLTDVGLMSFVQGSRGSAEKDQTFLETGMAVTGLSSAPVSAIGITISEVLERNGNPQIKFMSLDLEGYELDALNGLDLTRHQPSWILVECSSGLNYDISAVADLIDSHYELCAKPGYHDYLFKRRNDAPAPLVSGEVTSGGARIATPKAQHAQAEASGPGRARSRYATSAPPIALVVFRRPDLTRRVIDSLRRVEPPRVLIVADGPREHVPDDVAMCAEVRALCRSEIDWPCEISWECAEGNLGLRTRVSSGLDWVFSEVDEAIVLEDDCVPGPDFIRFCAEMLDRFRDDDRIGVITGDNLQQQPFERDASYYFSRFAHCWGWATWRRAWSQYDEPLQQWPKLRSTGWLNSLFPADPGAAARWRSIFDQVHERKIDTWDYGWVFSCWVEDFLTVTPATNLVQNIGSGPDATHTAGGEFPAISHLAWPLAHPPVIERLAPADDHVQGLHFGREDVGGFRVADVNFRMPVNLK